MSTDSLANTNKINSIQDDVYSIKKSYE